VSRIKAYEVRIPPDEAIEGKLKAESKNRKRKKTDGEEQLIKVKE